MERKRGQPTLSPAVHLPIWEWTELAIPFFRSSYVVLTDRRYSPGAIPRTRLNALWKAPSES